MLSMIAWLYGLGVAVRNRLYDKGIFGVHDLGARTISIGNITAGGTGKTPLVAYVASELAAEGEKVCILTRGYGREDEAKRVLVSDGTSVLANAATAGDEPVELATKLLGKAIVIADADRVGAAEWAKRKFGVTAFVLDDGFQHRKAGRDVDVVCIDATDPFGGENLLPTGRLREQVSNLARADVIVITRGEQIGDISVLRSQISNIAPDAGVIECRTELATVTSLNAETPRGPDKQGDADGVGPTIPAERVFAFCGLGNPESFFALLRQNGLNISGTQAFRDHHNYAQRDVDELERFAPEAGAEAFITTGKDAVKLVGLRFSLPCYVAELEVELDDPAAFASVLLH